MVPGIEINGRVRDDSGATVSHAALILAAQQLDDLKGLRFAFSSEEGAFSIGVPPGDYRLWAFKRLPAKGINARYLYGVASQGQLITGRPGAQLTVQLGVMPDDPGAEGAKK
jgi:hypothetical protein